MTHIADLASISYSGFTGPVLAVGWLEWPQPFTRGPADPNFRLRLQAIVERPFVKYWGEYYCTLCKAEGKPGPESVTSQAVLLVPGRHCVYETPSWIGHYISDHFYRPPDEFCDAVMSVPKPGSAAYGDAVAAHLPAFSRDRDPEASASYLYELFPREHNSYSVSLAERIWRRLTMRWSAP
jgi:hypothetical protein